ncbi:MAG: DegT/DnrJ/EryC1/StrS family aminotransferase [Nitrososphaera sp.]|nr:DegT/DnrJ/EryC1/StrS family aminotransferase [Nitrososphaera sp.]
MRIGRTLPPTAAPIGIRDLVSGIRGLVHGEKEIDRFRSELKEHFGVKHCFLVSSGKAALTLILLALKGLYPGRDKVLIPAFTCYSVPSSIIRAGLRIRLCDLHQDRLDFDFSQLSAILSEVSHSPEADTSVCMDSTEASFEAQGAGDEARYTTKRLLAVVPVHLYGFPADVLRMRTLVRDSGITVVEDASQAMGETWEGRELGTFGDVSFFSFGRGKALSTVEGGAILTDRDDIAQKLERHIAHLPSYGSFELLDLILRASVLTLFLHPLLFWVPRSMPFLKLGETIFEPHFPIRRMSSFQAGLAGSWKSKLQKLRHCRKKNVNRWIAALGAWGFQELRFESRQVFGLIRFPVRVADANKREFLLRESARRGLGLMPVYPNTIGGIPELIGHLGGRRYPVAESRTRDLITLPTHAYLTERDVMEISGLFFDAVSRAAA